MPHSAARLERRSHLQSFEAADPTYSRQYFLQPLLDSSCTSVKPEGLQKTIADLAKRQVGDLVGCPLLAPAACTAVSGVLRHDGLSCFRHQ